MLFQVTIKKGEIFHEHRAEAASRAVVRLHYIKNKPDYEIISIGAPTNEAKPGQPYIIVELPTVTDILRLYNGYILIIFADGTKCHLYASETAENAEILKAIQDNDTSATEEAKQEALRLCGELEREERVRKEEEENFNHCKQIANDLEAVTSGDVYKCPHCGELHSMSEYEENEHENEDGETVYTCPNCGKDIEEYELEAVSLYDYLSDCYNIEYTIDSNKEFISVCICVAWGGPSIYIDTGKRAVCLYWWGSNAQCALSGSTVDAVNEWAEEYYNI